MKLNFKKIAVVVAMTLAVNPLHGIVFQDMSVVEAAGTISSYNELVTAASKGGTYTLADGFNVKEPVTVKSGTTLTIKQAAGKNFKIATKEEISCLFDVKGTLKLVGANETDTVYLRGGTSAENGSKRYTTTAIVKVEDGGKLEMENTQLYYSQSRAIVIEGGTATMSSGKIITNDGKNSNGSYGGAVMVKSGGTFKMSGGSIQKNDHGAVYILEKSTFEMTGGSITNNSGGAGKYTTGSLQYGGGVYVDSGVFRMTGGIISGNSCYKSGAGVFVDENGTFCVKKSPYIASTDDVYLVNGRQIKVEDSLSAPSGYTAPLCTINVDSTTTLGSTIVTSSIDALEASGFVDMFALRNTDYTLASSGKKLLLSKNCTINYNGNGGLNIPDNQTVKWNENTTVSSVTPTRTGYTFTGWNTNIDGNGTSYSSGSTILVTENTDLYAQWSENNVTVSYSANGGSNAPASTSDRYTKGVVITYEKPVRTGYRFIGWNTKTDGTGVTYNGGEVVQEDMTLYAQWEAEVISVVYNYNDGTNKANKTVQGEVANGVMISNEIPVRDGYIFEGWNTSQDGSGGTYQSGAVVTTNLILYAQWKKVITYSLTYDTQGGYFNISTSKSYTNGTIAYISTEVPQKDGYTFAGWNMKADGSGMNYGAGDPITISADIILYAQWTKSAVTNQNPVIVNYAPILKLTSKSTKLQISWEFSGEIEGYEIAVCSGATNNKYKVVKTVKDKNSTTYLDSALKSGKSVKVKVRAYTTVNGKKIYSKYSSVKSKALLGKATLKSVAYKKAKKQTVIQWKKVSGASGFEIYQKNGKGKYKKIYTAKATSGKVTLSVKKAKKGTKISYKIRYYKKSGSTKVYSAYSAVKSVKKTN